MPGERGILEHVLADAHAPLTGPDRAESQAAELADAQGEFFVVGDIDAAVAGGEVLGIFEAEAPDVADGADKPAFVLTEHALGAILDDAEVVFAGQVHDGVHVRAQAVKGDRHDRLGARGDFAGDIRRVHLEGIGIDVGENRDGILKEDGRSTGNDG